MQLQLRSTQPEPLSVSEAALHFERRQTKILWIKVAALAIAALVLIAIFMTIQVRDWGFALPLRGRKVLAMILVGFSVAYSSVLFQTVTNNRILTPSIIGFDSMYMLIQTVIVYVFGGGVLAMMSKYTSFVVNVALMVFFASMLYRWLFNREGRNLYFLVLIGIIFGTLFGSFTSFMQMMIDPNDFAILQGRMFASINSVNEDLLWLSVAIIVAVSIYAMRYTRQLDVISLGREQAINLGVDHPSVVNRMMMVIAVLVSVSTALVGPITFFGLLVANLTYRFLDTYRHTFIVASASLMGVIALCGGQLLVERVFKFDTSISVIVNFIGGLYFLYLLLRETNRD
jgi:iron complex transport system permease protein